MTLNRAKQYNRLKLICSLGGIVLDITFWLVIILSGLGVFLAEICYNTFEPRLLQFYLFAFLLGILSFLVHFPLNFYSSYILEHQFLLSAQSFWRWLWEKIKGILVGIILGGIVLTVFFVVLQKYPTSWWFFVWLFLIIFTVILSRIAPLLIFPLFYKFKPLENQTLKDRIQAFAAKWNLKISGTYQFNLSKNTKKANAAFTGIGKSKRIILGDTLLTHFDEDEIMSVFVHEVGHYHHKHLMKGIILNSMITLAGLWLAAQVYAYILQLKDLIPSHLEALPYLALIFILYGLLTGPLGNFISRKYEFQADQFAASHSERADSFKNSLKKLAELNLADETPHPIIEFLFYSHPSIQHRLEKL